MKLYPSIRRFVRNTSTKPPGNRQKMVDFESSIKIIKKSCLTRGKRILLASLLNQGTVIRFGTKLGLEYGKFAKNPYDIRAVTPVIAEMADELKDQVDLFMAPDDSDILPGLQLATYANVPLIRVRKNHLLKGNHYAAEIESYTRPGKVDILSFGEGMLRSFLTNTQGRIGLGSDIVDVAEMTFLHAYLCELARKEISLARLTLVAALFEKMYTGARIRLSESNIKLISGIQISDLGIQNEEKNDMARGWISLPQITGISFSFNKGSPVPTPQLITALN